MNWKIFKNYIAKHGSFDDECKFVLGIDIGSCSSILAYWDVNRNEPSLIDMSGGYGKPQMPTVLQFVPETGEWIFGEYAILNKGYFNDITIWDIVSKLGLNEYMEIGGKLYSCVQLMSKFLRELVDSCKNINPKADIAGIVISTPFYLNSDALEELRRAVIMAGFEKEFIGFIDERECALRYRAFVDNGIADGKVLLLDYGNSSLRGGIFDLTLVDNVVSVNVISSVVNYAIAAKEIEKKIERLIKGFYYDEKNIPAEQVETQEKIQLDSFFYQNKFLLFQTGSKNKKVKLYYNFTFPAFQKVITDELRNHILSPVCSEFSSFIEKLFVNTLDLKVNYNEIKDVVCCGAGFEMFWVKECISKLLPGVNFIMSKTSKGIIAQGACIAAASALGIVKDYDYIISDNHRLSDDYGIMVLVNDKEKFIPIVSRNSFWWDSYCNRKFILNDSTDSPVYLSIFKRNALGFECKVVDFEIDGLPKRPRGTTKISLSLEFEKFNKLRTTVTDCGFGDFYPASGFEKVFTINV